MSEKGLDCDGYYYVPLCYRRTQHDRARAREREISEAVGEDPQREKGGSFKHGPVNEEFCM